MRIVKKSETNKIIPSAGTTIHEYSIDEPSLSGAAIEVNGRYPEYGFAVNEVSKELAFVISGSGYVITTKSKHALEVGDLLFLDKGEQFAWQGNVTIFTVTTPKFDPKQHVITYG
ncbi:hypothetical protein HY409_02370 [Candidatus Gottesmanbacteria bacterium]|nr:hypothetical protein [Candidatus Gottesmanbacteria bacterium]